jgi:hypothetical protein
MPRLMVGDVPVEVFPLLVVLPGMSPQDHLVAVPRGPRRVLDLAADLLGLPLVPLLMARDEPVEPFLYGQPTPAMGGGRWDPRATGGHILSL